MTLEKRVTDLPTVATAQLTDIVMAVQGYVNPSNIGVSVQETWSQILALMQSNIVFTNAGNPNGALAGSTYQMCWDSADNLLWVCTVTGTASTAVWTKAIQLTAGSGISISQAGNNITISASAGIPFSWTNVSGASATMASNNGYVASTGGLCTLTLPTTSNFGDLIYVTGIGGSTAWEIVYGTGQYIQIGNAVSTTTTGNIASTNTFDAINLVCTVANTSWQAINGPQGNITIA